MTLEQAEAEFKALGNRLTDDEIKLHNTKLIKKYAKLYKVSAKWVRDDLCIYSWDETELSEQEVEEVAKYIAKPVKKEIIVNKAKPELQAELARAEAHKAELQAILDEEELAQAKHEATLKRIKRQREQRELEQKELEHELEVTKANYETKAKIVELNHKIEAITEEYNNIKARIRNSLNIDRVFTPQQRSTLYLNAGGKCQQCGDSVTINNFEADHIIAYSNGGKTTLENGQCLCIHCNRQKGNK